MGKNDNTLWSITRVCEELGISRATYYRWRNDENVDFPDPIRLKPNGDIKHVRSEILEFIEQRRVHS